MKTTEGFMTYPVKIIDGQETVIIYIICECFRPEACDYWQLQGAAAYVWSVHKYTHAVLIGLGLHKSCHSPFEAGHLTLKPIDSKIRSAVTAHLYIPDETKPWTGEWWKSKGSRTQGSGWKNQISTAEMQAEITLDMTNEKIEFAILQSRKQCPESFEKRLSESEN